MTHEGYLRNLLVRKAYKTGEIIIDIITSTQIDFDLSEYVELLKKQITRELLTEFYIP